MVIAVRSQYMEEKCKMKKPYTICHMMISIDGRIDCAMTSKLRGVNDYYTAKSLHPGFPECSDFFLTLIPDPDRSTVKFLYIHKL